MSGRLNYADDSDPSANLWYGALRSTIRGKRGQAFLRELRDALLAMPHHRLISESLSDGCDVCALGEMYVQRSGLPRDEAIATYSKETNELVEYGLDLPREAAHQLNISESLAWAIVEENDAMNDKAETPEHRWQRMLDWTQRRIKETAQ